MNSMVSLANRLKFEKPSGKALTTNTRSAIIGYIVFLFFRNQSGDSRTATTYVQLLEICTRRRDCGPRRLQTQLGLLQLGGFLRRDRGLDGRECIYLLDFNPIEKAFSKLEAHLRKAAARSVDALWEIFVRLAGLFAPSECANFFAASGYDRD